MKAEDEDEESVKRKENIQKNLSYYLFHQVFEYDK